MNKRWLIITVEWVAVFLLLFLIYRENIFTPGSRTPEQAHRLSESGFHYGPSTIVRKVTVPFDKNQVIFLGTYKEWFSADSVQKRRGGWVAGGGVAGIKIERDKGLSYSWEGSSMSNVDQRTFYKFYGYVSDERILTVELLMTDKETGQPAPMRESITADHMFLFLWEAEYGSSEWQSLRGLDKDGNVIYEQKFG
ncbi:hypothetical protein DFQ01_10629 [Paenibacillus cellulosilyticus]|uniref:Uncharacterized protein n=1 Tax=Paenibacillus cellulosilyticus TaxID=375489 RepID=A0A2V2YX33_9BACL|nr:hypothetical protein [Paenibacillus cellulosilyticus]PWW04748.1 hypothetical protein DFQ01_10629 [Paenibacillus cellulosilyticus]QKS45873.1 hypothetical protein HUB94_16550 [Paenibacillus cellulosilyticus]